MVMRNLLIIYNVIFLLFGNVLFSSIHYLHDHNHDSEVQEDHECNECIIIKDSNNYILDFNQVSFSNNIIDIFVYEYYHSFCFDIRQIYSSRAPPIS